MQSEKYQLAGGVVLEVEEGALEVLGTSLRRVQNPVHTETVLLPRGTWLVRHHEQGLWHQFCRPDMVERAIGHAQRGYGWRTGRDIGELQFFIDVQAKLQAAQTEVRRFKQLTPEDQQAFTARWKAVQEELKNARKPEKLSIAWRIGKAAEGKDSLGRPNPNVSEYRIATAERAAGKLVAEMREICDRVERRALTVRFQIVQREGEARQFHGQVGEVARLCMQPSGQIDALRLLEQVMRHMAIVNDKPWRNLYHRSVVDDLRPAKRYIEKHEANEALKYLNRVRFAIEALDLQRELVELLYNLSLFATKRPRTDEAKKRWHHQLAIHKLELQQLIESIPTEVRIDGKAHGIDSYLRGRSIQRFRQYCETAVVSLNCVTTYPGHRQHHLVKALESLRYAEQCW